MKWRLPSVKELETLIDGSRTSPAIDLTAFPNALPGEPDRVADQLITNLGTHLTGAAQPPPGWEPHRWTLDEAQALAGLLRPGVERLAREFGSFAA